MSSIVAKRSPLHADDIKIECCQRKDNAKKKESENKDESLKLDKRSLKGLYTIDEVPPYMQGNRAIVTGYRLYYSYSETFFSAFEVHNGKHNKLEPLLFPRLACH